MLIALTGPRSVGKTTLANAISQSVGIAMIDSDELIDEELTSRGQTLSGLMNAKNFVGIYDAFQAGVDKKLENEKNLIGSLAGGLIFWDDFTKFKDTRIDKTIVLLPYEDTEKSIEHLAHREKKRLHHSDKPENLILINTRRDFEAIQPLLISAADQVIYTQDRSVEDLMNEACSELPILTTQ